MTFQSDLKERHTVRSELYQDLDRRLCAAGIAIAFPQRDRHIRSGDQAMSKKNQNTRDHPVLNTIAEGNQVTSSGPPVADWRLKVGLGMFVVSILLPIAGVPLAAILIASTATTATVTGGLLVLAEIMGLVSIGVMGKSGYAFIKSRMQALLKRYGPPNTVGPIRYKIGLVLFSLPILFGWISIYAAKWIPGFESHPLIYAVGGDLMILVSLFMLGGDFWDKVRALFIHNAKARFF